MGSKRSANPLRGLETKTNEDWFKEFGIFGPKRLKKNSNRLNLEHRKDVLFWALESRTRTNELKHMEASLDQQEERFPN